MERGDPLEIERGDPLSNETRKHRLGLCSTSKKSKFLQSQARIDQHDFQAARAEEEQRLLQGLPWQQKLEFREAHQ